MTAIEAATGKTASPDWLKFKNPKAPDGPPRGRGELGAVMLFYVRRHTGADGSFEWYVLNGHTRRRASKFFPTRAAAAAARRKLQTKRDIVEAKVLRRTPNSPSDTR
jgi:hypothetical protein